ncbi:hypothetical protein Tco_1430293 [Tanacetum coccineum]
MGRRRCTLSTAANEETKTSGHVESKCYSGTGREGNPNSQWPKGAPTYPKAGDPDFTSTSFKIKMAIEFCTTDGKCYCFGFQLSSILFFPCQVFSHGVFLGKVFNENREPLSEDILGATTQRDTGSYYPKRYWELLPKEILGAITQRETGMSYGKMEVT